MDFIPQLMAQPPVSRNIDDRRNEFPFSTNFRSFVNRVADPMAELADTANNIPGIPGTGNLVLPQHMVTVDEGFVPKGALPYAAGFGAQVGAQDRRAVDDQEKAMQDFRQMQDMVRVLGGR